MEQHFITRKIETEEKIPVNYPSFFKSGSYTLGLFAADDIVNIFQNPGYNSISKQTSSVHLNANLITEENKISKEEFADIVIKVFTEISTTLLDDKKPLALAS